MTPVKVSEHNYVFEELAFAMSVLALDLEDDMLHRADESDDKSHCMAVKTKRILSRLEENVLAAQEACSNGEWAKAADECFFYFS